MPERGLHDDGRQGAAPDAVTIKDQPKSVAADVRRIRNHPLVPGAIRLYGYIYDIKTGRLVEVPEATEAGTRVPSAQ